MAQLGIEPMTRTPLVVALTTKLRGPSPDWLANALGFGSGRALSTGTAWAGLCLICHHPTQEPPLANRPISKHRPTGFGWPCARWPGTSGSWLAGHFLWVLVWTGACYWHGVGGFVFNSPSSPPALIGAAYAGLIFNWGCVCAVASASLPNTHPMRLHHSRMCVIRILPYYLARLIRKPTRTFRTCLITREMA